MAAQRSYGGHEKGVNWHARSYKHFDNRPDLGNAGWSDDTHLHLEDPYRFPSSTYNRFGGSTAGYAHSSYDNSVPSSHLATAQPGTPGAHSASSNTMYHSVTQSTSVAQPNGTHNLGSSRDSNADIEDIAHHFVYRYYSLLHSNPAGLFSIYARTAQLCKRDVDGNRVVASGHAEIKNFYDKFAPKQTTVRIRQIEAQNIGNLGAIAVLIVGDVNTRIGNATVTKRTSQFVVLSGDQTRSRFQIVNDITFSDPQVSEKVQAEATPALTKEAKTDTPAKSKSSSETTYAEPQTVETNPSVVQDTREKARIVLFGLPHNFTVGELKDTLTQRLNENDMQEARVLRVDVKRSHQNGEKGSLFAFVQLDSRQSAELVVGKGVTLRGKPLTVEAYKRNHSSRDSAVSAHNTRAQSKPNAW